MSQTIKTLISLRELILNGELAPGAHLLELALVDRLGVSRTPIRAALARLAQEGLLEKMPAGGYIVRKFTERDINDAIEMRGTIEGMAARLAAERGVGALAIGKLKDCLACIDTLLEQQDLTSGDIDRYLVLNGSFHRQLIALSESFVLERMLEHVVTLPFASPNAFVIAQSEIGQAWKVFFAAQEHHKGIVEAIEHREGGRAEALAREHARLSLRTLRTALKSTSALSQVPGFRLISSSAA
jgi:GntR family transcriptional regulator of vanillate catabolism